MELCVHVSLKSPYRHSDLWYLSRVSGICVSGGVEPVTGLLVLVANQYLHCWLE